MTQCDERVSVSPAPIRGRLATWLGAPRYGHVTCARSFPLSLFPSSLQTGFSLMLSRVRGGWVQDVCLCVWKEGVREMIRAAEFWTSWSLLRDFWGRPKRRELQYSIREVTRLWTRIEVVCGVREGRRRFMLRRWKEADRKSVVEGKSVDLGGSR